MILNDKTQEEFGYDFETARYVDKVYIKCDYCENIILRKKLKIKETKKITENDSCGEKDCIIKKREESCQKKYGFKCSLQSPDVKSKIKTTNLEKYGVENPLQSKEIQDKIKTTNLEKYGVENTLQSEEIKDKIKATNLERYGVITPSKNKNIQNKMKATNIERYGAENPQKNILVQTKTINTNLIRYGTTTPLKNKNIQDKIKTTNLEKYGVENPLLAPEIQIKIRKTCFKRYGVEYPIQSEEIKDKIKATNLERYGVEFASSCDEFKQRVHNTKIERYGTVNVNFGKTENEIKEWLNSFGFNFKSDSTILEGKEIDLLDNNIGIEYCGLFWHTELSLQPRDRTYHYNKYLKSKEKDVQLITIFSDEWEKRQNQCKNFLKSILNKFETKIYARKTIIKEITKEISNQFYEENHIQGKSSSTKIAYGLYFENELVGVMSLGNHHRQKDKLVLNRLCFKDGIQVVGGASKLFSKCIIWAKENNYSEIISWSDNRWSLGNVYEKLNFTLEEELSPDYSYVKLKNPKERFSKQSFKKSNKGIPKEQTELAWATENGYARIWDCGKKRWIYSLNT